MEVPSGEGLFSRDMSCESLRLLGMIDRFFKLAILGFQSEGKRILRNWPFGLVDPFCITADSWR